MIRVVLASSNAGKLREFREMLASSGIELHSQGEFDLSPAPENAPTFVENALAKARHVCRATGLPAIADDSGLEVDALGGAPGVRSARYAGESAGDDANNRRLLADLADVPMEARGARFRAVLVYLRHADDPAPLIAQGEWRGTIAEAPRGAGGFGYDPLFLLEDDRTAAELSPAEKNRSSHRGQALAALHRQLEDAGRR